MTRATRFWLQHPVQAMGAFWKVFRSPDPLGDTMAEEQQRLQVLCNAIRLYKFLQGSFPSRLEDLCFSTRDAPGRGSGFIPWSGPDTFTDSFGHAYQYASENDRYVLKSPGLEKAKAMRQAG